MTLPDDNSREALTDAERIDKLEAIIRQEGGRGGHGVIVLGAWWGAKVDTSKEPDGFSVNIGELFVDSDEWPSLRDAIDDAISSYGPSREEG